MESLKKLVINPAMKTLLLSAVLSGVVYVGYMVIKNFRKDANSEDECEDRQDVKNGETNVA